MVLFQRLRGCLCGMSGVREGKLERRRREVGFWDGVRDECGCGCGVLMRKGVGGCDDANGGIGVVIEVMLERMSRCSSLSPEMGW